ncbi:hypothetical protein C1J03_13225 [Sulfitobacter sp. SK012]|uniref:DUF6778 family protein n=1 Tax=Sulfitobacter sp. SK012 TaxID=1389005 RepID=UPI000E0C10AE|nr:DUF6778 family protein [Sulfitobacter sp. SK012]AXI46898.1 hypothetical protein C1J03_13225 [Sulfitobacter sp. SK012]
MMRMKLIAALTVGVALSACGSVDFASRNAPFEVHNAPSLAFADNNTTTIQGPYEAGTAQAYQTAPTEPTEMPVQILNRVSVQQVNVLVPQSLRVSEANRYYPSGDIVWREDPIGNRHAQVQQIFQNALAAGTQNLDGDVPVVIDVVVERFHALTEKARYTVGGVHSIRFNMVIRDAETGQALSAPRVVRADLDGFGGQQAINAEARGVTQKVRISNHLAEVIRQELSRPEGYVNANLGFFQAVNKI